MQSDEEDQREIDSKLKRLKELAFEQHHLVNLAQAARKRIKDRRSNRRTTANNPTSPAFVVGRYIFITNKISHAPAGKAHDPEYRTGEITRTDSNWVYIRTVSGHYTKRNRKNLKPIIYNPPSESEDTETSFSVEDEFANIYSD